MPNDKLHIQMFSVHGLIRAENLEMGRDADTGGQIKYVLELGRRLSEQPEVGRVDLFTRLIQDKRVSDDYGVPVEPITDRFRIIRIQCGGRRYMRKELLWPHLDEYADRTIRFIKREGEIPDLVHGHYPDAGYVTQQLATMLGVPMAYTGHSLGRSKLERLIAGGMSEAEAERRYKLTRRIAAEEAILAAADLVVTSTRHEIHTQYDAYDHPEVPRYAVLPPGINVDKFYPFYHDLIDEAERSEEARYAQAHILQELNRFFSHPDKPLILALCRPDKRKNISGLVRAFGEDLQLQAIANLAIFAGLRRDIDAMEDNEREVLTQMLLAMDKYDLYGKMAIPKRHDFEFEVPALYRVAAERRGVFVNSALTEPFGLTLLEAAATGLPIVTTNDGGPTEIIANCDNGILVDPTDTRRMAEAIRTLVTDGPKWETFSKNGILKVREFYTWESHAKAYVREVREAIRAMTPTDLTRAKPKDIIGRRMIRLNAFVISDIDHTLIGEDNSRLKELAALLKKHREHIGFGVATGRNVDATRAILKEHGLPAPDVMICSVGTEAYYGRRRQYGQGWATHIGYRWQREKIRTVLKHFPFLEYQPEEDQREFKVSYFMDPGKDRIALIHDLLTVHRLRYKLIYSHDRYLDILPVRASKGKAIRYMSHKWDIPLGHFLVCGDSGNDAEMLRGELPAVVVGNYSHELDVLRGGRNVFFAKSACAGGILEGLAHYRFLEKHAGENNNDTSK